MVEKKKKIRLTFEISEEEVEDMKKAFEEGDLESIKVIKLEVIHDSTK